MKLSPWFKTRKHKPLRIGYYQCKCCLNKFWWNGKYWSDFFDGFPESVNEWRGIIK
jgi:hypothetical protein